jgi:hypothetical protein
MILSGGCGMGFRVLGHSWITYGLTWGLCFMLFGRVVSLRASGHRGLVSCMAFGSERVIKCSIQAQYAVHRGRDDGLLDAALLGLEGSIKI